MYRVFGYDDMMRDFSRSFDSLFKAARFYIRREKIGMYVQFIDGITADQKDKIDSMC
jgi:hypothetical protein